MIPKKLIALLVSVVVISLTISAVNNYLLTGKVFSLGIDQTDYNGHCLKHAKDEFPDSMPAKEIVFLGADRVLVQFIFYQKVIGTRDVRSEVRHVFQRALSYEEKGQHYGNHPILFSLSHNDNVIMTMPNAHPPEEYGCVNIVL